MMRAFKIKGLLRYSILWSFIRVIPAIAQEAGKPESLVTSSLKTFGALMVVLVLIVVLSWAAKKYLHFLPTATVRGGVIKVIETKPLGPKRSLHVVEIEGRRLLIGSSEGGIAFLQNMDQADTQESE